VLLSLGLRTLRYPWFSSPLEPTEEIGRNPFSGSAFCFRWQNRGGDESPLGSALQTARQFYYPFAPFVCGTNSGSPNLIRLSTPLDPTWCVSSYPHRTAGLLSYLIVTFVSPSNWVRFRYFRFFCDLPLNECRQPSLADGSRSYIPKAVRQRHPYSCAVGQA
jgi:hypothetical protein